MRSRLKSEPTRARAWLPQIVSEQPIAQNSQMVGGKGSTSDKEQRVVRALERPPQPFG